MEQIFKVEDLGLMAYREAWAIQEAANERVAAGGNPTLFLVEHPPVITFGRRAAAHHVIAPAEELARLGIEAVATDRGGDVTFHGPGQLVVYPIVRLIDHRLSVGAYVRRLEDAVIATLAHFGIEGLKDESAIGVWVRQSERWGGRPAKICALGVRIRRGVSMHGIALNVDIDLTHFNLIVPCGLSDRPVTSMRELLGAGGPTVGQVKPVLAGAMQEMVNGEREENAH
jgi:lipoyl(octanoyl) transferase